VGHRPGGRPKETARRPDPLIVDALALFVQKPDGEFVIDQRFSLGG